MNLTYYLLRKMMTEIKRPQKVSKSFSKRRISKRAIKKNPIRKKEPRRKTKKTMISLRKKMTKRAKKRRKRMRETIVTVLI